jgi:hypothetical protein
MRTHVILLVFVSLLTACSSPVLKWIDTPAAGSGGDGDSRVAGQTDAKEIVSFSFGIDGETDLPIGKDAGSSGEIPILIILPMGTSLDGLSPKITYVGKSLNPPSGKPGNFGSPVVYTVTAEDGSTRDYIVRVYVKGPSTKEIIRFTIDLSRTGDFSLGAEGMIDQDTGNITVAVPSGTVLKALTARITHTAVEVTDPQGRFHPEETFEFSGDFSGPTTWTAVDQNYTTKTYTVRVVRTKDSLKEITDFSLNISGETDIIGAEILPDGKYPILVIVPEKESLDSITPFINYRGVAISPADKSMDFSKTANPVTYTVSAEDGSTRDYEVKVIVKNDADTEKLITGFYFTDPLVEGVIDQDAESPTITLRVPANTNLSGIRPEVYYKGASVSPLSGQPKNFPISNTTLNPVSYTVRGWDNTIQKYEVYVFIDDSAPPVVDAPKARVDMGIETDATGIPGNDIVIVEFPTYIENPAININYPGAGTAENETINRLIKQILAEQAGQGVFNHITKETINNNYNYNVTVNTDVNVVVINPPPDNPPAPEDNGKASIDGFYFANPAAIGVIGNTGSGTPTDPISIDVAVPYGTDLRNLTAGICYTGKEITGIPGATPLKDTRSFLTQVDYTVKARNDTAKTYRVKVTVGKNNAKEITGFTFDEVENTSAIISAMPNANDKYPIDVTIMVPSDQAPDLSPLSAKITHTGASITGQYSDFSSPVDYTVTAENGTTKTYTVRAHLETGDDDPKILGFYFTNPLAAGVVNQDTNTITVTVPSKTNTSALAPVVYFNGISVKPGSGSVNNFSGPSLYTVTGRTGKTRSYTVSVNPTASITKDITSFVFSGIPNTETVIGAVPDADGTYPIAVWVPSDTSLAGLAPAITHTGAGIVPPAGTPSDFINPQTYTIVAEDGSTRDYKVTVNKLINDVKVITSFVFNEVPLADNSGYARIAGSIDQEDHTIMVKVPSNANTSGLMPTLTYIGRSIKEPGGSEQTVNPFTGTAKDFDSSQTYTVTDQSGNQLSYTVTVIKQSYAEVKFEGETDLAFAGNVFDQHTGVVTVTVDTKEINSPYEWYVDGVKQPVGEAIFTLNVGNGALSPGRHEIMVSGKKDGLHYTGKVYFTVSR